MIFLSALGIAGYIASLFAKETKCRNVYFDDENKKVTS
jgi:hypothetical protein